MNHSIPQISSILCTTYVHDYNLVRRANEINLVAINKHPVLNLTYVVDFDLCQPCPGPVYPVVKA